MCDLCEIRHVHIVATRGITEYSRNSSLKL